MDGISMGIQSRVLPVEPVSLMTFNRLSKTLGAEGTVFPQFVTAPRKQGNPFEDV
jgi:hypothetical protein